MSALPPKADIVWRRSNVRFVPKAHSALRQKTTLFDHLVDDRKQTRWDCDAERLCGFQIDEELEFCRLHHRQIGRLLTLENAAGVNTSQTVRLCNLLAVAHQAAGCDK